MVFIALFTWDPVADSEVSRWLMWWRGELVCEAYGLRGDAHGLGVKCSLGTGIVCPRSGWCRGVDCCCCCFARPCIKGSSSAATPLTGLTGICLDGGMCCRCCCWTCASPSAASQLALSTSDICLGGVAAVARCLSATPVLLIDQVLPVYCHYWRQASALRVSHGQSATELHPRTSS